MTTEVFIQTGGATDFVCPGDHFRLRTGQVCVMPRGVPHAENPVDTNTPYSVLVCGYRSDGITLICGEAPNPGQIRSVWAESVETSRGRDAFHYVDEIAAFRSVPRHHQRSYIDGLLNAFYVTVLDEIQHPSMDADTCSPKVVEVVKLVRANLANSDLSVVMLAESLRCSSDYLSRLFHRERGITMSRWIIGERIEMAQELLRDPRYNVAEVGWACGFTSTSYFVRVFHAHAGMTPNAFRYA